MLPRQEPIYPLDYFCIFYPLYYTIERMSSDQKTPGGNAESAPTAQLGDIFRLFLRLGATAFGGPAAHVAMMRAEVVHRRKWLSEQQFLDLLGATNLIPGPNSTEMAIHLGFLRGGIRGLILAGVSFIFPAMLIVLALAWGYVQYGSTPQVTWLFYGIQPVIIAIVGQALWNLGKQAVKGPLTALVGAAALLLYLLGINELALLFGSGLLVMLLRGLGGERNGLRGVLPPFLPGFTGGVAAIIPQAAAAFNLPLLFFTFLKIGSVLYGSGYVLLAFLRSDFVERLGWLTEAQLIDAIAVGQVTPGPVFTTATFIGYLMGGLPGALLATLGIFLPAFFFVWLTHPYIPRLRQSRWAGALLDGVNVASLGLMAGVTIQLAQAALVDPLTVLILLAAVYLLVRYNVNATWLVLGAGLVGLLRYFLLAS